MTSITDSLRASASHVPTGIDFGTTFTRIAYVDADGEVRVLRFDSGVNENPPAGDEAGDGGVKVPSALFFSGECMEIGTTAVAAGRNSPDHYAECFKREMGRPHFHQQLNGYRVPPEVLGALLLERLREESQRQLGPLRDAVLTAPAYFAEMERAATRQAGALAGWTVRAILNEPSAAAIAHVFGDYTDVRRSVAGVRRILVYDFGGGTFDASLVAVEGRSLRTVATSGEIRLGGRDLDERLAMFLVGEFHRRHGVDLRADHVAWRQVDDTARRTKHILTREIDHRVEMRHGGLSFEVEVSRARFNQLISPLINRTFDTCRDVLEAANLTWSDLDEVVLVGGSSRIPLVAEKLREVAGRKVHLSQLADELVVRGAAMYAVSRSVHPLLEAEGRIEVVNVNAHSLGIAGKDRQTKTWTNRIILPRNSPLPATVRPPCELFRDGQKQVPIHLLEGESTNPKFCKELGTFVVNVTAPMSKGTRIDLACHYDVEGCISVSARIADSRDSNQMYVTRKSTNQLESLEVWRHRLTKGEEPPAVAAAPPPVRIRDVKHIDDVITRLDLLYGYVGQLASRLAPPISAVATARLVRISAWEMAYSRQTVVDLSRDRTTSRDALAALTARAKMEVERAEAVARHAMVALGREFIAAHLIPPGAEGYVDEIRRLQSRLDDVC